MGLKDQLIRHEGNILHAYQDSRGFWSVGVGRCIDRRVGGGISERESIFLLDNDIQACYEDLYRYLWFSRLTPVRQSAVAAMRFNLGMRGLLGFEDMIAALERQDYAAAKAAALDSVWHRERQVGNRSAELAEQLFTGVEVA